MITDAAIEAAAAAIYEAKYENNDWSEAKAPETWREYARLALVAGLPYVDMDSDDYWNSLPTIGASEDEY